MRNSLVPVILGAAWVNVDAALLILRVWFGLGLALAHGIPKLSKVGPFIENVGKHGFPMPWLFGPAAIASELVGGLLLAIGLLSRPAALFVALTMAGAAFQVHAADPYAKKELGVLFLGAALVVLVAGPGRYSIDARLTRAAGPRR